MHNVVGTQLFFCGGGDSENLVTPLNFKMIHEMLLLAFLVIIVIIINFSKNGLYRLRQFLRRENPGEIPSQKVLPLRALACA